MKLYACVAAVFAGLGLLLAGGCTSSSRPGAESARLSIDHSSERLLLVSLDQACRRKDYSAIIDSMEPSQRPMFKTIISATRRYTDSLDALAATVESKIGQDEARKFRDLSQSVLEGTIPSPLEGAMTDGQVDWKKVSLLDEGEVMAVMILGAPSEFDKQYVLVQAKGKWYISPRLKGVPPDQRKNVYATDAKNTDKTLSNYSTLTDDLRKKIASGKINRDNFRESMAALRPAK